MIIKELERAEISDKFGQAGHYAESQLAFYLKREFKDDPQILVFNNLRFEKQEDACQLDHLILHPYGIIIIESKSVTTRVEVNELGEWKRWFNNQWQGMPSPILQAQRQGKFLKEYLEDHVESLLNKILFGRQAHFTRMPIDILVAISDSGIINRPRNNKLENVAKADQISENVKAIISTYRKKNSLLSLSLDVAYEFNADEVIRISNFLLSQHKPVNIKSAKQNSESLPKKDVNSKDSVQITAKVINVVNKPVIKPIVKNNAKLESVNFQHKCSHCQSGNISILYVHSYYFKCHDCGKNTSIKNICSSCAEKTKIRKNGLQFFVECERCETSKLFHTNK
ncbi:NERD domain-containing protein [Pseudanabaena sp. FACHB-1998]|uniref:nuclease-related domain-containing protein n=1 Tax=Pseudanabaena sp. FACHB-1998 TaxID=2692858 RepID=UPI00168116F1|nr:nuclease-related domain-containing protein [Pseudanabaena sp. FACHB-1998]MBD2177315.1 NERD domain-containing protein [Pseudanabaena sp. FACHB-1998]